jgi:CubicO group peptidase (beta-lactamase class C family)
MSSQFDRRTFVGAAGALATGIVAGSRATLANEPAKAIPKARIDDAIKAVDGLVEDVMKRTGIPGMAVAVVAGGKVAHARGYGVRRIGEAAPVDADTVFQIASVSKSIAATVVARAVDAGVTSWDTPVAKHLPWFRLADPWVSEHVTIADMFSHRSGLPDHGGDNLEDLGYGRRAVLERLRFLPLGRFRDQYAYTNFGLTAAAEAVAAAAGKDWETLSAETLYAPLGMNVTSSRFADFQRQANRATGHIKAGNVYETKLQRQPDAQSPAGGVSSSANDLARWMLMVLSMGQAQGREFITTKALGPAISVEVVSGRKTPDVLPSFYGYGFGVGFSPEGQLQLNHSGAFSMGAGTRYIMAPSAGVGIAVLTNAWPVGAAEAVTTAFTDLLDLGRVSRDWLSLFAELMRPITAPAGDLAGKSPPANAAPAAPLSAYAGTYGNPYFGEAAIAETGGQLHLRLGPAGKSFALRHWQGDVFAVAPASENEPPGSLSSVTFERVSQQAAGFVVGYLNENGMGRFVRA